MRGWDELSKIHDAIKRRLLVIGLDGTPHSFLRKEIDKGSLPNLANLFSTGTLARMESEIPTISSVAWASFMTGVNPGEHGIFGFTDRKPASYDLFFPNYNDLKVEPVWERISRDGGRCCVMNVPSTYPAKPLNGILVSGFVAPNLERAVYPAEAYHYLSKSGYRIDVDAGKARESIDLLLEDLHATLEKRREAMFHFYNQEYWDFFMCVFTGTDRLHHFLWRHYEQADPVYKEEFLRYYRRLDEIIGEFVSMIPEETVTLMLSDHGFCGIEKEVFLNPLLAQKDFLAFTGDDPHTIADIAPAETRAYCMDPGRIYLNRIGREPAGIVQPGEVAALLEQIKAALLELRDPDTDGQIIDRVEYGSDLFSGPQASTGPDLVAVPRNGFDLKGRMSRQIFSPAGLLSGMHTQDDAFVFVADSSGQQAPSHIRELAPLIKRVIYGKG
ncbi:MAG: alkaline phosphatase family protein [Bacteroidales bacterium]